LVPDFVRVVEREFFLDGGDGVKKKLADVREDGGVARRNAVLGDGGEEFAEDMVDVRGSEEIPVVGGGDFCAEAVRFAELEFFAGVEETEGRVIVVTGHAAAAAVNELKLATSRDTRIGICFRHGSLLGTSVFSDQCSVFSEIGLRVYGWRRKAESSVAARAGKKIAAQKGGGTARLRANLQGKDYHGLCNGVNTYLLGH
jgi:hypothetical protein